MLNQTPDLAREAVVLRVSGDFDGIAARRVEARLLHAQPGVPFHLDLTQVREFHDFGIAVLASALKRCQAEVALRGLRLHQIRLLRYFGVEAGPVPNVALGDVG